MFLDSLTQTPQIVWTFWDGKQPPAYIDLCLKSIQWYVSQSNRYRLIILNTQLVKQLIPDIRDVSHLRMCHQVDYYRVAILKKFGGLYLDADTIVLKPIDAVFDKLSEYDYVGFGCSYTKCINGYPKPSNGAMASQVNGILVTSLLKRLDSILDSGKDIGYFGLGKLPLWDAIAELIPQGYHYWHFDSSVDGSRDNNGNWISTRNHLSASPTQFLDESKVIFVFLENHVLEDSWYIRLSQRDILFVDKTWLSSLFRKAFEIKEPTDSPTFNPSNPDSVKKLLCWMANQSRYQVSKS